MMGYVEMNAHECACIYGGRRNGEIAEFVEFIAMGVGLVAKMFYTAFKRSRDIMTWLNMNREYGSYRR